MKRPYLDQWDRLCMHSNTTTGDLLLLNLSMRKLFREIVRCYYLPLLKWIDKTIKPAE